MEAIFPAEFFCAEPNIIKNAYFGLILIGRGKLG